MAAKLETPRSLFKSKSVGTNLIKQGWIKKKSRHLKAWRKRYAIIKDDQYLCTYHQESMKNNTEKIDLTACTIYYTIDRPKEFQIFLSNNNTEFSFECDTILDANEWLRNLKRINKSHPNTPMSPKGNKSPKKMKKALNDPHV